MLAADLGFLERSNYARLEAEVIGVKRMLSGLINKLKAESR